MMQTCVASDGRRCAAGHSLVEAMVAAGIFSFGVLGLVPLFVSSSDGAAVASRMTQATALAESKLDELLGQAYNSPLLAAGTRQEASNLGADGVPSASAYGTNDGTFIRSWTVLDVTLSGGSAFKEVAVDVAWYDLAVKRVRHVIIRGGKSQI